MGTDEYDVVAAAALGGSVGGLTAFAAAVRRPRTNWRFWLAAVIGTVAGGVAGFGGWEIGLPFAYAACVGMVVSFLTTVAVERYMIPTPLKVFMASNPKIREAAHVRPGTRCSPGR